ncbi:hypothetical protein [Nonomuraea sp. NPDC003727]
MLMTLAVTASLALSGAPAGASAGAPAGALAGAPAGATQSVTYRGATITLPASWKVEKADSGAVHVITGSCSRRATECQGFWLMGPQYIRYATEGNPFRVDEPYHPSSGVMECVRDRRYYSSPMPVKPQVSELRPVGAGHKAYYRQWKITCHTPSGKPTSVTYPQRIWYLPASKILVVDQWSTPGLNAALTRAVWR